MGYHELSSQSGGQCRQMLQSIDQSVKAITHDQHMMKICSVSVCHMIRLLQSRVGCTTEYPKSRFANSRSDRNEVLKAWPDVLIRVSGIKPALLVDDKGFGLADVRRIKVVNLATVRLKDDSAVCDAD